MYNNLVFVRILDRYYIFLCDAFFHHYSIIYMLNDFWTTDVEDIIRNVSVIYLPYIYQNSTLDSSCFVEDDSNWRDWSYDTTSKNNYLKIYSLYLQILLLNVFYCDILF